MDYRGISRAVDRTGTCRLWEKQLVTSRAILVPEHGTENSGYRFFNLSLLISLQLFNATKSKKPPYCVPSTRVLSISVSSAVSGHGTTKTGVLSTYRHKARERTGGEMREKCISLRLPVPYAIFRLCSIPTVT
jgi:hypothetical protein